LKKNTLLAAIARIILLASLSSCALPPAANTLPPANINSAQTATPFYDTAPSTTQLPGSMPPTLAVEPTNGSGSINGLPPEYYSPLANAQYVSKATTLAVRYGTTLSNQNVSALEFTVQGSKSGTHSGQITLADDQKTVVFKPDQPFTAAEQVKVSISGLSVNPQVSFSPISYSFNVAANQQPGGVGASSTPLKNAPASAFPNYLTVPQDIPHFTVTTTGTDIEEGDIFVAPIPWTAAVTGAYLLILDGQGNLIYYQSMANDYNGYDFKVLPNGDLSYFSQKDSAFYVMDTHYQIVKKYQAGNGYTTDLHDLLLLPNGNVVLMAYDAETVDMSKVVPGGKTNATVTGLIVQELDPSNNVIFQWRSWDYISFTDSTSNLTDQNIDLIHGNGLALASDGNLLLSSRNLSEITKVNLQTGAIMWRLGGKANQFQFVNDQPFAYQHNIGQLANGDITVFDNHGTEQSPTPSRGVEYKVDEANKTVTKVWQFQDTPPIFATFMGDTQRLPDGNTFLDWGAPFTGTGYQFVNITEVNPQNQVIFQLTFDQPYVSYRAFRAPWQGSPATKPDLAFKNDGNGLLLGYSWNGATEVASWMLYGGSSPSALKVIDQKAKDGFETQTQLTSAPKGECYFQAAAIDKNGNEMARSAVVSTDAAACPPVP
jgi:hypothetical protein